METYTIKPGDSLNSIALKIYKSANKWREIADLSNIANPNAIKVSQVLNLPPKKGIETAENQVEITVEGKAVNYLFKKTVQKIVLGKIFKKGIFRMGSYNTERFVKANTELLSSLKMSGSEVNALLATSENAENLDAVNTWDNSFMSWGMFQWTLGQGENAGELAALLKSVKEKQAASFKAFFGDFGLDVSADTNNTTGYLLLNGKKLKTVDAKEALTNNNWALRFALAGQEPSICAVQVLHAINRFNTFYFSPLDKLSGFSLNQLLSSEYAASLLLDQHVNRPGHVIDVVNVALQQTSITAQELSSGNDELELKVLKKYIEIRKAFGKSPMTNSDIRATIVKKYLDKDLISSKIGSFKSNRAVRK